MAHKSYVEESKKDYGRDDSLSNNDLQVGCLQRIATATEKMAKSYVNLEKDRDWYKNKLEEERACVRRLLRKNAALKGVITRMKKKGK